MADIDARLVWDFRKQTGAKVLEAREVLIESSGDFTKAEQLLRERGKLKAAKKSTRQTSEGLIVPHVDPSGRHAVVFEVNCETDFVARNPEFKGYTEKFAAQLLSKFDFASPELDALKTDAITKLSENIRVNHGEKVDVGESGYVFSYSHTGGRIGVLVVIEAETDTPPRADLEGLGRDLAMQIAAMNPRSCDSSDLDQSFCASQRIAFVKQAEASGKPSNVIERIVEGQLKKLYAEVCLLNMPFIKDDSISVSEYVMKIQKTLGCGKLSISRFARLELGVSPT